MANVLEVRNVSKFFGKKQVLDNVSFSIKEGEVFGFIGPNGAGKTTLIKMVLGLLHIDQGQIAVAGHDVVNDFERALKHASGIIESPDMYKGLTGFQNLSIYARVCGASKAKIDEVIEMVGMQKHVNDKLGKYSLGMRQRIGVAQALLSDPKIMILDEPTNGLDPAGIKSFRVLLRDLAHTTGLSVLVSSHILQEMQEMCDSIGIIDKGKMLYLGNMEDLETRSRMQGTTFRYIVRPIEKAEELVRANFSDFIVEINSQHIDMHLTEEVVLALNRLFMDNGIGIYGLSTMGSSLEENFMQITGGGIIVE